MEWSGMEMERNGMAFRAFLGTYCIYVIFKANHYLGRLKDNSLQFDLTTVV